MKTYWRVLPSSLLLREASIRLILGDKKVDFVPVICRNPFLSPVSWLLRFSIKLFDSAPAASGLSSLPRVILKAGPDVVVVWYDGRVGKIAAMLKRNYQYLIFANSIYVN